MYAEKTAPRPDAFLPTGPKPVFLRENDVQDTDKKALTGEELYIALAKGGKRDKIAGIQRIRSLWRIYLTCPKERIRLISNGLGVRGAIAPVYDLNPFTREKEDNLTRVTIKDIPLSVDDDVIRSELQARKSEVVGSIIRQKLRVNGQLTSCLNGDRVLYIRPPSQPLPRKLVFVSSFVARIYHLGQPLSATCSKCLQAGHHVSTCTNDVRCRQCKESGHIQSACPEGSNMLRNAMATNDASSANDHNDHRDHDVATPQVDAEGKSAPHDQAKMSKEREATRQTSLEDFIANVRHGVQRKDKAPEADASTSSVATGTRSASKVRDASNVTSAKVSVASTSHVNSSEECDSNASGKIDSGGDEESSSECDDEPIPHPKNQRKLKKKPAPVKPRNSSKKK